MLTPQGHTSHQLFCPKVHPWPLVHRLLRLASRLENSWIFLNPVILGERLGPPGMMYFSY